MARKILVLLLIVLFAGWMAVALTNGAALVTVRETIAEWLAPDVEVYTGEVEARTDAPEYRSGEEVGISVKNLLEAPVRTHVGSSTPIASLMYAEQKYSDGSWRRRAVMCKPPHCRYTIDSPYPLDPGETRSFRWKPVFFEDGTTQKRPVPPGVYRLLVRYQVRPDPAVPRWEWHQTLTNEFTVR